MPKWVTQVGRGWPESRMKKRVEKKRQRNTAAFFDHQIGWVR